jgi:hypothetical protein
VLDERALQGRSQRVRPIRTHEATELQHLDCARHTAQHNFVIKLVALYEAGVSTSSLGATLGTTAQNVSNMIRRRRKWHAT